MNAPEMSANVHSVSEAVAAAAMKRTEEEDAVAKNAEEEDAAAAKKNEQDVFEGDDVAAMCRILHQVNTELLQSARCVHSVDYST